MATLAKTTGQNLGTAILFVGISPLLPAIGLMYLLAKIDSE